MASCESREARYVPWSFGEIYECLSCGRRERQRHNLCKLRGENYEAVYPFPEHDRREQPERWCWGCGHKHGPGDPDLCPGCKAVS
jgi:hypothetical protein